MMSVKSSVYAADELPTAKTVAIQQAISLRSKTSAISKKHKVLALICEISAKMRPLSRILLLILLFSIIVNASEVKWLIVEVHHFNIKPSCLGDVCQNPEFKNTLKVGGNSISSSIEINATATNGIFDRIVSAPLKPTHLGQFGFISEIVGTDPMFKFSRSCDNSSYESIITHTDSNEDFIDLNLIGKCFETRVKVSIYKDTCPWCAIDIDQASITSNEEQNFALFSSSTLLIVGCILASIVSICSIIAFICACKLNRELTTKLRRLDTSASPSTQDTESHYDLPWKQYGCRTNTRLVGTPYTPTKPIENLVCVSPSDQSSSLDRSPFGVCLGTTHLYNSGTKDERYIAIRNACEDSGRDSI